MAGGWLMVCGDGLVRGGHSGHRPLTGPAYGLWTMGERRWPMDNGQWPMADGERATAHVSGQERRVWREWTTVGGGGGRAGPSGAERSRAEQGVAGWGSESGDVVFVRCCVFVKEMRWRGSVCTIPSGFGASGTHKSRGGRHKDLASSRLTIRLAASRPCRLAALSLVACCRVLAGTAQICRCRTLPSAEPGPCATLMRMHM